MDFHLLSSAGCKLRWYAYLTSWSADLCSIYSGFEFAGDPTAPFAFLFFTERTLGPECRAMAGEICLFVAVVVNHFYLRFSRRRDFRGFVASGSEAPVLCFFFPSADATFPMVVAIRSCKEQFVQKQSTGASLPEATKPLKSRRREKRK